MRILLGLCVGALLGALAVSVLKGVEIRRLEAEVEAAKQRRPATPEQASRAIASGLIPGLSSALAPSEASETRQAASTDNAEEPFIVDAGVGASTGATDGRGRRWSTPEGFEASVLAQRMRRAQMKQALIERHRLRREDVERIDTLQTKLNEKLAAYGEEVSLLAEEGDQNPKFSTVLTLTQDVAAILAESQDELDDIIGEPIGVDDRETQVWNLIDLETFRPAAEALQRRQAQRGPGAP